MSAWPGGETAPGTAGRGGLRASDADREQVLDALKTAYVRGQLTKDQFDAGIGRALTSRTYAELAVVTAGIPAAPNGAQPGRRGGAMPVGPPVLAGQTTRSSSIARTLRTRQWPWVLAAGLVLMLLGAALMPGDAGGGRFGNMVVFLGMMLVLQAAARGLVRLPPERNRGRVPFAR
jgi:Domain of unknown function (DUF1707)